MAVNDPENRAGEPSREEPAQQHPSPQDAAAKDQPAGTGQEAPQESTPSPAREPLAGISREEAVVGGEPQGERTAEWPPAREAQAAGPPGSPGLRLGIGSIVALGLVSAVLGGLVVVVALQFLGANVSSEGGPIVSLPGAERPVLLEPEGGLSAQKIFEGSGDAVVHVTGRGVSGPAPRGLPQDHPPAQGDGSGFIIDEEGFLVTNAHVIQGANRVTITLSDGTDIDAEVIGTDLSTDIALLKINPGDKDLTAVKMGNSSNLSVGDSVFAIGNPFGEFDRSMSHGIISALGRTIRAPNDFTIRNVIQTDAAVNPGNSGGPLFNARGEVIGVTAQIASGASEQFAGVAFVIPSNTVADVVSQMRKSGSVKHAWLGISGTDLTPAVAEQLKLPVDRGAIIVTVTQGGPAIKSGLKGVSGESRNRDLDELAVADLGDVILKLGSKSILSMDDLLAAVESQDPGDEVEVEYLRAGKRETAKVTLGDRPASGQP